MFKRFFIKTLKLIAVFSKWDFKEITLDCVYDVNGVCESYIQIVQICLFTFHYAWQVVLKCFVFILFTNKF